MTEPRQRPDGERAASERSAFERAESELVEFVRSIDVRAPESLHREVQALVADASRRKGRLRRGRRRSPALAGYAFAGALAAAVAAIAIAIGLSGGGGNGQFTRQASALTLDQATGAAPRENPHSSGQLTAAVQGVAFPYWEDRFGWRSTGTRSDRVNGRAVTTVFYADRGGRQIGYAIVAGAPAPKQDRGAIAWRNGTRFRVLQLHGATVVSWLRDGRLCVVAGRGVSGATLLALASWHPRGTVA